MNEPDFEPLCLMPSGLCHCVLGKSRIGTKHAEQNHRHHDHRRRLRTSVTASPGFSKKVGGSLRARGIGPSASATSIRPACRACGTVSWRFAGRRAHAGLPASFRRPPKTTPEGIVVYCGLLCGSRPPPTELNHSIPSKTGHSKPINPAAA